MGVKRTLIEKEEKLIKGNYRNYKVKLVLLMLSPVSDEASVMARLW